MQICASGLLSPSMLLKVLAKLYVSFGHGVHLYCTWESLVGEP